VGRIICAIILLASAAAMYVSWRRSQEEYWAGNEEHEEDLYSQSPEGHMKKLLFDDYQPLQDGKYVVKEVEDDQSRVVPAGRSGQPAVLVKEEKVKEFALEDFFDLDADIFRSDAEPRSEFNFLLCKELAALKDVLFAYSVAFFWANHDKGQMVLEASATDSQNFIAAKRFAIERDIVSQVAGDGKPQILGRVNPISEKELIRFYESTEYVKSVVAVPVYYLNGSSGKLPVGVLVADSKAEDAFGPETLSLLGHFTKLTSALIKSYTQKYDLLLDSELLTSIRRMQDRVKSEPGESAVLSSLADEANRLVNWDFLTVTMYADDKGGWVVQKIVNRTGAHYVAAEQSVDFTQSIVGRAIRTNTLEVIDDVELLGETPRFAPGEQLDARGSLLCVPISSVNRCYGALTLESRNKANFSGSEVETIYRLVENSAASLEVLYMNDLVKDYVVIDHMSGLYTRKHFVKRLEDEVLRAEEFGEDLALVTIAIDSIGEHLERHGNEGIDTIVNQVSRIIRANIRPYDIVGRQERDKMGALLVNTAASDAYLWAEKVRKQIASQIMTVNGRSFSITVSAGVCGLGEGMQKDELIAGTTKVLDKAIENGGNLVRVF
jgi:diguanylate cyclase (GGDEF)-like protein